MEAILKAGSNLLSLLFLGHPTKQRQEYTPQGADPWQRLTWSTEIDAAGDVAGGAYDPLAAANAAAAAGLHPSTTRLGHSQRSHYAFGAATSTAAHHRHDGTASAVAATSRRGGDAASMWSSVRTGAHPFGGGGGHHHGAPSLARSGMGASSLGAGDAASVWSTGDALPVGVNAAAFGHNNNFNASQGYGAFAMGGGPDHPNAMYGAGGGGIGGFGANDGLEWMYNLDALEADYRAAAARNRQRRRSGGGLQHQQQQRPASSSAHGGASKAKATRTVSAAAVNPLQPQQQQHLQQRRSIVFSSDFGEVGGGGGGGGGDHAGGERGAAVAATVSISPPASRAQTMHGGWGGSSETDRPPPPGLNENNQRIHQLQAATPSALSAPAVNPLRYPLDGYGKTPPAANAGSAADGDRTFAFTPNVGGSTTAFPSAVARASTRTQDDESATMMMTPLGRVAGPISPTGAAAARASPSTGDTTATALHHSGVSMPSVSLLSNPLANASARTPS